jgi:PHD/YefM family antitoxin component YafN of YafNO toxin-antitoxin module
MHSITIKSDRPLVVIPEDEYESMKETLELLATNPSLPDELNEERRNVAKGKFIRWTEFKKNHKVR